jgi:hypothetical protein
MPDTTRTPPSRLSRWALWLVMAAAILGIALEAIRASLGHPVRAEGFGVALIILSIAAIRLGQLARRR